jgi:Dolichyl-phosphate-mannose-protein mannosyltransferase
MPRRVSWPVIAALLLAAIAVAATFGAIGYPLGTLGDEWAKIDAVRTGNNRYYHPLLMIELTQAANLFLQASDLQSIAEVGRLSAALAGGLLVFATFRLARLVLPDFAALAATAATAATPLVTVHARIMKEDIFLAPCLILGLAALIELLQAPTPGRALRLGALAGLAAGAKYVGALFLLFAVAAILLVPSPEAEKRRRRALTVAGSAVIVFMLIELPVFAHLDQLRAGFGYEVNHAMVGHDVPLPLSLTFGGFHLSESLWPGLGPALLGLGLLGLTAPLFAPPPRRLPLALMASFALLWYAVHEITPLKPYPDSARYMLPLAPLLCILAAAFVHELLARRDRLAIIAAGTVIAAAMPALGTSIRANGAAVDPRAVVPAIVAATGLRVATDRYADYDTSRPLLGTLAVPPARSAADLVVTANLTYDRYDNYAARHNRASNPAADYYQGLKALPHLEVSNGRPTLAYFNPVLRVVAMDGSVERLAGIAYKIHEAAPSLVVRQVQSQTVK